MEKRKKLQMNWLSTTDLRMQIRGKHERRALQADRAKSLREDGKQTLDEIAEIMGFKNDSSVRALLNEEYCSKQEQGTRNSRNSEKRT